MHADGLTYSSSVEQERPTFGRLNPRFGGKKHLDACNCLR